MPLHPILHKQGTFRRLKLGAKPPRKDERTLQLATYLDGPTILPKITPSYDLITPVPAWPMYANDRLGDCTVAAAAHMIQAWTTAAGRPSIPAGQAVELAYWMTGAPPSATGSPGGPTDTGRYEIDVLNYWRHKGIGGDKIAAYVEVDPLNHLHMRAAIYLFGGVYTGIALPRSAQTQAKWQVVNGPNGKPGSWGGHAVPFHAYNASTFTCITWGHRQSLTVGFNDHYVQEAYAILSPDFFDGTGHTPAGFDVELLKADLAAITR